MPSLTLSVSDEFKNQLKEFLWVNWSEIAREEAMKKLIFENYIKIGSITDEEWEFFEKINWHTIDELGKKNPVLRDALEKKINEIVKNPQDYKPLKNDLAGERRVHIMKSFVLKFEIDNINRIVTFIMFGHHDEAYRR